MKISRYAILSFFLVLTLCLAGNAIAKGPKAPPFMPDISEDWAPIFPSDLYPDFKYKELSPACSNGLSASSDEFFFFVKKGTVNNVVVYFQGGGACWDPITCFVAESYDTECTDGDNPTYYRGIFDFENPENPFKDWSFVFVPYCTGDVHLGANDKEYSMITIDDDNKPVVVTHTIQHRGAVNFHVVLKWMKENISKPHEIFVTGSSAGSYGAIAGFPWIKEMYKKSHVSLLGDAGMGVNPAEYNQVSQANWNSQFAPWLVENPDEMDILEIWKQMAKRYPRSKMAEFTNAFDGTQISFYYYMFITLGLTPPADPAFDWHVKMWEGLDFKAESPNYRYYVAPGAAHTILGRDLVYDEISEDGIRFVDWLEAIVKNQGGTGGHGAMPWVNIACEDCRY